jgi:hypothetical protein
MALSILATPAGAEGFDGAKVASAWYESHYLCRMGEDPSGQPLAEEANQAACAERQRLTDELLAGGWCFDKSEQEWTEGCPVAGALTIEPADVPVPLLRPQAAGPASGSCDPPKHSPVPNVIDQPYPAARKKLIAAGWVPFFNREMMERTEDQMAIAEQWIPEVGFYEVDACSGTGMGYCRAEFVDQNKAWLRVITQEGDLDEHTVSETFFVCDPDD